MERYDDLQKMGHTDYTRIGDLEKRFSLRDDGRARLDSEVNKPAQYYLVVSVSVYIFCILQLALF